MFKRTRCIKFQAMLLGAVLVTLGGCSGFLGETETDPRLPGERISIMLLESDLKADPTLSDETVVLPAPVRNPSWPQPGGRPSHSMQHLAVGDNLDRAWRVSIGAGSDDRTSLLAVPLVADGRIHVMDADGVVSTLAEEGGRRLWRAETQPADEDDRAVFVGGMTTGDGRLFVITGYGEAIAFDAATGKQIWRVRLPAPARGSPTFADGKLFAVTLDNQSVALSAADGALIWNHSGITEISALLGGPSPTYADGAVVMPYSSGELFVMRAANGRILWADSLSRFRAGGGVTRLGDIRASSVIDDELLFTISHAGRLTATDLRSGTRVWERSIGGVQTPWLAGDYLYTVSISGEVICLRRTDGRVRWIRRMPVFVDPDDRTEPIVYAGPVLVSDRLLLASSTGEVYAISPYTGDLLGRIDLGDPVYVAPIVANGTIYFQTDSGSLIAYR